MVEGQPCSTSANYVTTKHVTSEGAKIKDFQPSFCMSDNVFMSDNN